MRLAVVWLLSALVALPCMAQDVETEYRVARRLAAEGSPQAAAALERVYRLAPDGPFADDALLEGVLLLGVPAWPEELGRIDAARAATAGASLTRIVNDLRDGDRAPEAAYRLALLGLEPLPGRDVERVRPALLSLAAGTGPVARSARYTLAWLDEHAGDLERAENGYQRLRVDAPWSAAAARASYAVGRLRLRQGRPEEAAARLQEALLAAELDRPLAARVAALRDVAVDALLARVSTGESFRIVAGNRPSAIAAEASGGVLIASRKGGTVAAFDAAGAETGGWTVDQPLAVLTSPNGGRWALTEDALLRLEADGTTSVAGAAGDLGSFSAAAADATGRVWVLDRKGERLAVLDPGAALPRTVWSGDGRRLSGLAWDGNRLLALDTRARSVVAVTPAGAARELVAGALERPVAIAVDPAGRIGVLDAKGDAVRFFAPSGTPLGGLTAEEAGLQRASALAFGRDGSLQLLDEGSGLWRGGR